MKNFLHFIKCRWSVKMYFSVDDRDDISAEMKSRKKKETKKRTDIKNKENKYNLFLNKRNLIYFLQSLIKNKMRYSTTSCHLSIVVVKNI